MLQRADMTKKSKVIRVDHECYEKLKKLKIYDGQSINSVLHLYLKKVGVNDGKNSK